MKIRGSANHVADKYVQLARDAQTSGDPVAAENYYQHAEHYFRLIAAAQEQYRQGQPFYRQESDARSEESYDDSEDESAGGESAYGTREPQPFVPRDAQPFGARDAQPYPQREPQPYPQRDGQPSQGRPRQGGSEASGEADRLPAFITGGAQQQQGNGQNGYEGGQQQADRYPMHRRRRRHRGPRGDAPPAQGADDAHSGD